MLWHYRGQFNPIAANHSLENGILEDHILKFYFKKNSPGLNQIGSSLESSFVIRLEPNNFQIIDFQAPYHDLSISWFKDFFFCMYEQNALTIIFKYLI